MKFVILDRGNAELAYPADWVFKPDPKDGHVTLTDPSDSCRLEISYFPLPAPASELPPLADQLRQVLAGECKRRKARPPKIVSEDRGDLWLAWAESTDTQLDTDRNERRAARTRHLVATNGRFQVLVTFAYWVDDAPWAVPAYERMIATLALGDGRQLESPWDHWSLREPPKRP